MFRGEDTGLGHEAYSNWCFLSHSGAKQGAVAATEGACKLTTLSDIRVRNSAYSTVPFPSLSISWGKQRGIAQVSPCCRQPWQIELPPPERELGRAETDLEHLGDLILGGFEAECLNGDTELRGVDGAWRTGATNQQQSRGTVRLWRCAASLRRLLGVGWLRGADEPTRGAHSGSRVQLQDDGA